MRFVNSLRHNQAMSETWQRERSLSGDRESVGRSERHIIFQNLGRG